MVGGMVQTLLTSIQNKVTGASKGFYSTGNDRANAGDYGSIKWSY